MSKTSRFIASNKINLKTNKYIMKSLINSVRLMGNVGATPAIKNFENGSKQATIRLATNEKQKNAKGEAITVTYWHTIVFRGKQAEIAAKYITTGQRMAIEGTLTSRTYADKSGDKKYVTEVQVQAFEFISARKTNESSVPEPLVPADLPF